nr:immunoglobulin heavy chain junction region [Macaca mulatta]MOX59473.1 immunoglobulin heavy chain junction region [Macaca mulatta]MOX61743.1 immunoglobulin heavy chain junction region [Macaca mulatta]MOX63100.1 immunoglobulin heavy chain junction region [Macaca mulatta]
CASGRTHWMELAALMGGLDSW